jgi:PKD repeat protein
VDFGDYITDPDTPVSQLSMIITNISSTSQVSVSYSAGTTGSLSAVFTAAANWFGIESFNILISDNEGRAVSSGSFTANVLENITANFSTSLTDGISGLTGQAVHFTDTTIGNPDSWLWNFGDGQTSIQQNPTHIYAQGGNYTVSLTVANSEAAVSDTAIRQILMIGTIIGGNINANQTWTSDNTYNLLASVIIDPAATVTIEPGTAVNLIDTTTVVINGGLVASGVTFSPSSDLNYWGGLSFNNSPAGSLLSNCTLINALNPLVVNNSDPTFSNVNIEVSDTLNLNVTNGILIVGDSDPNIDNLEITNYPTGLNIDAPIDRTATTPILTNLRIRNTVSSTRNDSLKTAVLIKGNANAVLDSLEVDNYDIGLEFDNTASTYTTTPTLTNLRIRNTTSSTRGNATGILISGKVTPSINGVEISGCNLGLSYSNSQVYQTTVTPTLANIRVRNSTTSTREGSVGMYFSQLGSLHLTASEVEDFATAILFEGDAARTISTPILTNLRVRNTSSSTRSGDNGIVIKDNVAAALDSITIENCGKAIEYRNASGLTAAQPARLDNITISKDTTLAFPDEKGIAFDDVSYINCRNVGITGYSIGIDVSNLNGPTPSTPTLANIRVRNSAASTRTDAIGVLFTGNVTALCDDMWIDDYDIGMRYIGDGFSRTATPALTNLRIRSSVSSTRNESIGMQLHNLDRVIVQNDTLEGFSTGLEIMANQTRTLSTPSLTNVRIRNSESSTRTANIGLFLGSNVSGYVEECLIEKAVTGIMLADANTTLLKYNQIIDCETALQVSGLNPPLPLQTNLIYLSPAWQAAHPTVNFTAFKLIFAGPWQLQNNTVIGYPVLLNATDAVVSMQNNVLWSVTPQQNPFILNNSVLTANYNDIASASGVYPGLGNINADPLITDVDLGNFRTTYNSPCIDAGNPLLPLDSDGTISDIGAYEYLHKAVIVPSATYVTLGDLISFTNASIGHSYPETTVSWDLYNDGTVDATTWDFSHTFDSAGQFSLKLTVTTGNLTDTKLLTNLVVVSVVGLAAPQNPTLAVQGADLQLSWNPITQDIQGQPTSVDYYLIYQCATPDGQFEYLGTTDGQNLSYNDVNGTVNGSRFYRVVGFKGSRAELNRLLDRFRVSRTRQDMPAEQK